MMHGTPFIDEVEDHKMTKGQTARGPAHATQGDCDHGRPGGAHGSSPFIAPLIALRDAALELDAAEKACASALKMVLREERGRKPRALEAVRARFRAARTAYDAALDAVKPKDRGGDRP